MHYSEEENRKQIELRMSAIEFLDGRLFEERAYSRGAYSSGALIRGERLFEGGLFQTLAFCSKVDVAKRHNLLSIN